MATRGDYSRPASPICGDAGLDALLAHHLPWLAATWRGAGRAAEAEAAALDLILRLVGCELVCRAASGRRRPAGGPAEWLEYWSALAAAAAWPVADGELVTWADIGHADARWLRLIDAVAALPAETLATGLAALATGMTGSIRLRGAYATPLLLADLLVGWAMPARPARVLDPACGAGMLLLRAAAWQHWATDGSAALWGVEADGRAAAMGRLALAGVGATAARVWEGDFLTLPADQPGLVDAVLANPPFVRHERLADDGRVRRIARTDADLDGRTDLHGYFWPAITARLREGGRVAIVTPASWLDAGYGAALRRYLLAHYALEAVIEPAAERWFAGVGVHTVVVLARRCADPAACLAARTRLVRLRRPLAELLPPPGPSVWPAVAALLAQLTEAERDAETAAWQVRVRPAAQLADADQAARPTWRGAARLAVPPMSRPVAACAPTTEAASLPWGGWLRAPRVLVEIMERRPAAWRRLGEVAQVRYPLKSGADRFFYLSRGAAAAQRIEADCLAPLLRTPRELTGLVVTPAALGWRVLLLPPVPPAQLPSGARRYVEAGARAGLAARPTCAARQPWYALPALAPAPLLWPRFVHARHAVWLNRAGAIENQTFYGILVDETAAELWAAVLNSSLVALVTEVCGRTGLGEGALQFAVAQAAALPVPDARRASPAERAALAAAFTALAAEPEWAPLSRASHARLILDDLTLALVGIADAGERADLAALVRQELATLVAQRRQRGRRG